jgi:hypothetical protein
MVKKEGKEGKNRDFVDKQWMICGKSSSRGIILNYSRNYFKILDKKRRAWIEIVSLRLFNSCPLSLVWRKD